MKEKELRIALVCYGGVSLVLYMHGAIKEILKLSRASKAYHALPEGVERQASDFRSATGPSKRVHDTEHVYFELLQAIGAKLNLRVVVDSIAGASAGGISGIVLARALAHDLSIDHLRDLWLDEADVMRLIGAAQRARPWSKLFLRPILWFLFRLQRLGPGLDQEIQNNLSMVLRSRWFEPPFDGNHFLGLLFDGLSAMRPEGKARSSLLPQGHDLDLAVSVTDFFGHPRKLKINSPAVISEREHALFWTFRYRDPANGGSELDDDDVPGLALAARATSNFPGAFPPAQLADLERLLAARNRPWPSRGKFIAANYRAHLAAGIDPARVTLVDGSVVNNKPFAAVLDMVRERPAYRDVDRRLIYIEPDPEPAAPLEGHVPTFIRTLEGAILEIPMHAPIYRELTQIQASNEAVKRMRDILTAAYPELAGFVAKITREAERADEPRDTVRRWRETANAMAAQEAGYAYQVYARLKTMATVDFVAELICGLAGAPRASEAGAELAARLSAWAGRLGAIPPEGSLNTAAGAGARPWIAFLMRADAPFRRRRLLFVMRGINLLYGRLGEPALAGVTSQHVDALKHDFQLALDRLRGLQSGNFASADLRLRARQLADRLDGLGTDEASIAAQAAFGAEVEALVQQIDRELDLAQIDRDVDAIVASSMVDGMPDALRRELTVFYLGFPFWDVWTYPVAEWRTLEEHREIRIDRISPSDGGILRNGEVARLKGAEFKHFAGFLSRTRREHDYLWGRLQGAERLIDIVADAGAIEGALGDTDVRALKIKAFRAILETEAKHLRDQDLIAAVRAQLDGL